MEETVNIRIERLACGPYVYIQPRWDRSDNSPPVAALERFLRAFFIGHPSEVVRGSPFFMIEPLSALHLGSSRRLRCLFAMDLRQEVRATPSYHIAHMASTLVAVVRLISQGDEDPFVRFDEVFAEVRGWAQKNSVILGEFCRIGMAEVEGMSEMVFQFQIMEQ